jgi:anthranilate/para-aminobenzoate synthase component I
MRFKTQTQVFDADSLNLKSMYVRLQTLLGEAFFCEQAEAQYTFLGAGSSQLLYLEKSVLYQIDHVRKHINRSHVSPETLADACQQFLQTVEIDSPLDKNSLDLPLLAWWGYHRLGISEIPDFHYQIYRYNFVLDWKTALLYCTEFVPLEAEFSADLVKSWVYTPAAAPQKFAPLGGFSPLLSEQAQYEQVRALYQACRTGVVYEAQAANVWELPYQGDSVWAYYRAACKQSPHLYSFFAKYADAEIFGFGDSSPFRYNQGNLFAELSAYTQPHTPSQYAQDLETLTQIAAADNTRAAHWLGLESILSNLSQYAQEAHIEQVLTPIFADKTARLSSNIRAHLPDNPNFSAWATLHAQFPAPSQVGVPVQGGMQLSPNNPVLSWGFVDISNQFAQTLACSNLGFALPCNTLKVAHYQPITRFLNKANLQHEQQQTSQTQAQILENFTQLG